MWLGYDPEACAPAPGPPTPRVIDATIPVLFDSPGYNVSDPDNSVYPPNTVCEWSIFSTAAEVQYIYGDVAHSHIQ